MDIFSVVSRHVNWLESRHAVAARNIANSDTPGFKAKAISPFKMQLDQVSSVMLAATDPRHITVSGIENVGFEIFNQNNLDGSHSGNDVMLEKEMRNVGETARAFSFDTSVQKVFHRMMMLSVKA